MVILGLLILLAGVVVILVAVFDLDGTASLLSRDVDALTIFLLGVASGLAILFGYAILRFGARREINRRRENKRLTELSEKLDKVEAERRAEGKDVEDR
jgi:hypothetical protein